MLKRGEVRQPHFAHLSGEGCGGEQVVHLLAKRLVVHLLRGGHQPLLRRGCASVGCEEVRLQSWELPPFDDVREEVECGSFRLDVGLLSGGEVVAGIEVFYTSRMSRFKQFHMAVPWLEVDAQAVLNEPEVWEPLVLSRPVRELNERRSRLSRYRSSMSLSQLRQHPGVHDAAQQYLSARFTARQEMLRPDDPWLCSLCLDELSDLQGWVSEPDALAPPDFSGTGGSGKGEGLRGVATRPFLHVWLRDMVPELYRSSGQEKAEPVPLDEERLARVLASHQQEASSKVVLRAQVEHVPVGGGEVDGFLPGVLLPDEWRRFGERREEFLQVLSEVDWQPGEFRALEVNCLVVRQVPCACGRQAPLIYTRDEVFRAEHLSRFLRPVVPLEAARWRSLPPRGVWENICPYCATPISLSDVHWSALLPGRFVLRLLQARGVVPADYFWGDGQARAGSEDTAASRR